MAEKDGKTEEPTGKRKSETRNKGQVAKSVDLTSGVMILAAVILMGAYGPYMTKLFQQNMVAIFTQLSTFQLSDANFLSFLEQQIYLILKIIWPILLIMFLIGIGANLLQVGFLFTTTPLEPKLSKITALTGLKRLFSLAPWGELLKGLAKIGIIGYISYLTVQDEFTQLIELMDVEIGNASYYLAKICYIMSIKIAVLLILIGVIDFFFQKRKHHQGMMMSRQEVKDENKQSEGDPAVKGRQRQLAMEMMRKSMMNEVPKATVVITNPTYIAIALQYERDQNSAPIVLAKGKRLIAERIRDIAKENNIPVMENKPLARGMFDLVQIGDEIPAEFYSSIAEVLAFVYNSKNKEIH